MRSRIVALSGWTTCLVGFGFLMGAMSAGLDQGMWLEERLGNDSDVLDLIGPNPPRTLALLAVAATLAA